MSFFWEQSQICVWLKYSIFGAIVHYFISMFQISRKPSLGIYKMQQLERKSKNAIWRHSYCITS